MKNTFLGRKMRYEITAKVPANGYACPGIVLIPAINMYSKHMENGYIFLIEWSQQMSLTSFICLLIYSDMQKFLPLQPYLVKPVFLEKMLLVRVNRNTFGMR